MARLVLLLVVFGCGRVGFESVSGDGGDGGGGDAGLLMTPSCVGLEPTCGPAGTSSCCSTMLVPGGTYLREFDVGTDNMYSNNAFPATLSSFELDVYDISLSRFRRFVDAGMGTQQNPPVSGSGAHLAIANSGWDPAWNANLPADTATLEAQVTCSVNPSWTATAGANEGLPMNCITWWEAMAFCAWDGGYLPTEAEWNYAAAGGDEQRAYPWSVPPSAITLDCSHANYYDGVTACIGRPNRVGSESPAGDSKWGHADLAGNVYEWGLDYFTSPELVPCNDCAQLTPAATRVARGGFFHTNTLRTADRYGGDPSVPSDGLGARCARPP